VSQLSGLTKPPSTIDTALVKTSADSFQNSEGVDNQLSFVYLFLCSNIIAIRLFHPVHSLVVSRYLWLILFSKI
jgi:hypothetical protein